MPLQHTLYTTSIPDNFSLYITLQTSHMRHHIHWTLLQCQSFTIICETKSPYPAFKVNQVQEGFGGQVCVAGIVSCYFHWPCTLCNMLCNAKYKPVYGLHKSIISLQMSRCQDIRAPQPRLSMGHPLTTLGNASQCWTVLVYTKQFRPSYENRPATQAARTDPFRCNSTIGKIHSFIKIAVTFD